MVGRRPQHAVSKLPCLVLSSAISCRSKFVQVVSPPLGWSPLSSFLVIWSPSGDTRGPSVDFEAVDMPCPGPFHLSHSVDYIYDFVLSLTQMLVFLSLYSNVGILLSMLVCAAASLFCACLVSVQVSASCHSWQHTGVDHLSLQVDGKVALNISRCLAYAAQPAMILRCISLS